MNAGNNKQKILLPGVAEALGEGFSCSPAPALFLGGGVFAANESYDERNRIDVTKKPGALDKQDSIKDRLGYAE